MIKLLEYWSENLVSEFWKCSVFPFEKQQLLKCILKKGMNLDVIGSALIRHMVKEPSDAVQEAKWFSRQEHLPRPECLSVLPFHLAMKIPLKNEEDQIKPLCRHWIQVLVLMTSAFMITVLRMMEVILKNFEETYKVVRVRVWKKLWRKGTLSSWSITSNYILSLWWDSHPVKRGVQQFTVWNGQQKEMFWFTVGVTRKKKFIHQNSLVFYARVEWYCVVLNLHLIK